MSGDGLFLAVLDRVVLVVMDSPSSRRFFELLSAGLATDRPLLGRDGGGDSVRGGALCGVRRGVRDTAARRVRRATGTSGCRGPVRRLEARDAPSSARSSSSELRVVRFEPVTSVGVRG
jgi:hypothetical protein